MFSIKNFNLQYALTARVELQTDFRYQNKLSCWKVAPAPCSLILSIIIIIQGNLREKREIPKKWGFRREKMWFGFTKNALVNEIKRKSDLAVQNQDYREEKLWSKRFGFFFSKPNHSSAPAAHSRGTDILACLSWTGSHSVLSSTRSTTTFMIRELTRSKNSGK